MNSEKIKIIYIVGSGRSGSTLLSIILGSVPGFFNAGELSYITRDGIRNEYCSCGKPISQCEVWTTIWQKWDATRGMSYETFQRLRWKYETNKTSLRTLRNWWFPGKEFSSYCWANQALVEAICEVTGAKVIVDCSKNPQRIPVLKRFADVTVIQLSRDFSGVLNSAKKVVQKDIKAGIEESRAARSTWKSLRDWVLKNGLSEVFSLGSKRKRIKYRDYINNPKLIEKVDPEVITINGQMTFSAPHMLAGNRMRMQKEIIVKSEPDSGYLQLTKGQARFAGLVDRLFWFWA